MPLFVDVGHEKDAFLHYLDLGPQVKSLLKFTRAVQQGGMKTGDLTGFTIEPDIVKTGKIGTVLSKGQQVVVQVAKEPISSKGPASVLTCHWQVGIWCLFLL